MSKGKEVRAILQSRPASRERYEKRRDHAIQRMFERYGLRMTVEEYEVLCDQMPEDRQEEKFMARRFPHANDTEDTQFYAVFWRARSCWVLAAYAFAVHQIVTFLPSKYLPQDLPPADEMIESLKRGTLVHKLRKVLGSHPRAPFTLEGEIAWALLDMPPMEDIGQARVYLKVLGVELNTINSQLNKRSTRPDEMTTNEYKKWLDHAQWAAMWKSNQIAALKAYISLLEQRARRLANSDCPEALLAKLIKHVFDMREAGRVTLVEEDYQLLRACKQTLRDLGWEHESVTTGARLEREHAK